MRRSTIFAIMMAALLLISGSLFLGCDNSSTRADDRPTNGEATSEENSAEESADEPKEEAEQQAENQESLSPALLDPSLATEEAPEQFQVRFETTKGDFVVQINREWAPNGADRFYNLVDMGFYDDIAFFRVIDGFMAQFGIHGNPEVAAAWQNASIQDDPVAQSNTRGRLSFATRGPNTRTTQLFINFGNNARLDGMGFSPIGEVIEGMDVVDSLYSGYGEGAPQGRGPAQGRIQSEGNSYLRADFPSLDYTTKVSIVEP